MAQLDGPSPLDRRDAQRRADQIRAFRAELAALRAAGRWPLTGQEEQDLAAYHDRLLEALAAEYDVDPTERAGQLSRGMRLLSFFGAVTLTAALYSLVARYWGRFDLPLQATMLAAMPVLLLAAVEWSSTRERSQYVAALFALVAYGAFWLAVGVLSWTLNIPVTPAFVWAGVVFGLGLAIPYRFRVVLAIALAAFAVASAGTLLQMAATEWTYAFERLDPLMGSGFSVLLLAIPLARVDRTLPAVARLVGLGIGLATLLVLSSSGSTSLLDFPPKATEGIYQAIMVVVSVAALVLSVRRGWRETVNLATTMLALFLLIRYADWFWDVLPRYVFFLVLAALAFGWLLLLRKLRIRLLTARA